MRTLLAALLLSLAVPAFASFSDFQTLVRPENIKPFALDVGGVLGAASVDTGRPWGFPGFEAGLVSGMQFRPDRDDAIMRGANIKAFGVPLLQAGVGLPLNTSIVVHGLSVGGVSILGGGARYTLFKAPAVGSLLPTVGVSAFGDEIHHRYFKGDHFAGNASVGWNLAVLTPFAAVGYDVTKIEATSAATAGVVGMSAWARGTRVALGTDITPLPLLRLRAAYQLLHGLPGATLDLLFKF